MFLVWHTEKSALQFSDNNCHMHNVMKVAMTGLAATSDWTGSTHDGRDGQHQDMLAGLSVVTAIYVKTTGGALARCGVLVSAGVYAQPPTMQTTTGGTESSLVMDMLTGLCVVTVIHVKMMGSALAH